MPRALFPVSLLVLLSWQPPASAQPAWACGAGTVRSIEAIDEAVTRETISTRRGDDGDVETFVARTDTQHRRSYVLAVQLGDLLYTSASAADPHGTLDPMRIVAGDSIEMCVSATQMIVEGPNGTDYRARLVTQGTVPSVSIGCRKTGTSSSGAGRCR
ncbi:MAG TPA: hypothetical protein VH497_05640 [Vicinamibacterales bacterium]|jgi:hypothetical protein